MHLDSIVLVLIQIVLVIALSRLVGLAFRRIKQPLVIGEIVAGIMLGPSLLGAVAPVVATTLFPPESIATLGVLSQIGLIFFMFLIGLELDPKYLKGGVDLAILISHVSILVPFSLGILLSLLLFPLVSNAGVSFTAFALFLGAAMSITAFPVLARIITENNLQNSRIGSLALTCAAVDDVTAWCLLLVAIAVTRTNSMVGAIPNILEAGLYIGLMIWVGRPLLRQFAVFYRRTGKLTQSMLAVIYICVVISALITETIGIHLIFGAFLLGAVMPKHEGLVRELAQKTEDFVLTCLLPIFFAYSGLRTQIGLLNSPPLWGLCALVVLVAIVGKYVGTFAAAKVSGLSNRDASALGWLMNTRGLTELIVLNIGLSLGVITPLLFTMLVIMALVTTFMTSPLLEWTYPKKMMRMEVLEPQPETTEAAQYKILVPVANPNSQQGLIRLAIEIARSQQQPTSVHPLSLIQLEQDYVFESLPAEADRLIQAQQEKLRAIVAQLDSDHASDVAASPVEVSNIVQVSNNVAKTTADIAVREQMNLILLGWHRPAFSSNRLGGRVGQILSTAPVDVAVFIDRQPQRLNRLLIPYSPNIHTELGIQLALRLLLNHPDRQLTLLRVFQEGQSIEFSYEWNQLFEQLPPTVRDRILTPVIQTNSLINTVIDASQTADLTIVGASREWGLERQTLGRYTDELAVRCRSSLLITRRFNRVASHHLEAVLDRLTEV
ncbi:cation:proton antiporter [Alkalinema sp. FACHB-956]|uniref:cation:proton antiporter n=1 Tax=Alkalinema sp. FACHB-956 TaxID=2692768 RepID=UPI001689FC92|nr:cation:proton antiporter [Alkalinema sp. FACHB-956]MBD2328524.1 cation:proton antiporter [Alkalinema sp. FACHB-956]